MGKVAAIQKAVKGLLDLVGEGKVSARTTDGVQYYDATDPKTYAYFKAQIGPKATDGQVRLAIAEQNAKIGGLPEAPMERAGKMGFDTPAYHATGADFQVFRPHPYRGAVSVAATPNGALWGAKAGVADGTGTGANRVMPLLMKSEGVEGLRLPQDQVRFLKSLPKVSTEAEVNAMMDKAPRGSFWGNFFEEVEGPPGVFKYFKKDEPKVSFADVQKTYKGADQLTVPNWGEERWSSNKQKEIGGKGWLQADESGVSASIVDPSIIRSRFAAFDPARKYDNDLLAGVAPTAIIAPSLWKMLEEE